MPFIARLAHYIKSALRAAVHRNNKFAARRANRILVEKQKATAIGYL